MRPFHHRYCRNLRSDGRSFRPLCPCHVCVHEEHRIPRSEKHQGEPYTIFKDIVIEISRSGCRFSWIRSNTVRFHCKSWSWDNRVVTIPKIVTPRICCFRFLASLPFRGLPRQVGRSRRNVCVLPVCRKHPAFFLLDTFGSGASDDVIYSFSLAEQGRH